MESSAKVLSKVLMVSSMTETQSEANLGSRTDFCISSAGQVAEVPELGRKLGGDLAGTDRGSQSPPVREKITALGIA